MMYQTKTTAEALSPSRCTWCGGTMRLVGSEPHPHRADVDLLTFVCVHCEQREIARLGPAPGSRDN